MAENYYEIYIQNPISATIFEKLGVRLVRYHGNNSYGRIGKFPCTEETK